jgi:glycerophosphoryl diester phosphodiesterase
MSTPFMLVAKAGGSGEGAENTCEAVAAVAALSAPPGTSFAVEVDVRLSADGLLIAMHDATIDRTTRGRGPVRAWTLQDLRKLEAGPRGERIPSLDELLEARGDLQLVIDAHDGDPDATSALVHQLRSLKSSVKDALLVASEIDAVVHAVRASGIGVRTAATAREALWKVLFERLRAEHLLASGHIWMVPEHHRGLHVVTDRFLRSAHAQGDAVWVFVIDEAEAAAGLRARGVSGVFTSRPRALSLALERFG